MVSADGYKMDQQKLLLYRLWKKGLLPWGGQFINWLGTFAITGDLYRILEDVKTTVQSSFQSQTPCFKKKDKNCQGNRTITCHPSGMDRTTARILEQMIDALSMAYPDNQKSFTLHNDASNEDLGALMYQHQEGKLWLIACGAWALTLGERNYCLLSGKLEFLVLKWATTSSMHLHL